MNIEIANKLVKLRKQNGFSQEELADKLGLSRQAVSKWERAEASPDTDNLICLAKLYNVSLDELLSTEDDVETIVNEQVKKDQKEEQSETEKKDDSSVHISGEGIHLKDDDGSEVIIDGKGVRCFDKDHNRVWNDPKRRRNRRIYGLISSILMAFALLTYILFGAICGMWGSMWIVFFVPDIIASTYKCIANKEAHSFNMAFASTFTFFLVCLVLLPEENLWHPMWTVFLAIPVYHIITTSIEKLIKGEDENVVDDEGDDKDEDDD